MNIVRRNRDPMRLLAWSRREWRTMTFSLVLAFVVTMVGAAINFNERLIAFFKPHAEQPAVVLVTNFLALWLIIMLVTSYLRWRAEAMRNQELEDIIDSINPDVLLVVDANRNILMVNASVCRMFGYAMEEVIRRKTELLYFDRRRVPGAKHEIYDALEREGFHIGWATGRKKDGKTFPLEIVTGLLKSHGGSVLLLRDATQRKNVEELLLEREAQLRQAQKMEALGLLAGGVAHDFNNLLTSILGFSNLALESLAEDHPVREDIKEVISGAERAAKLTAQLLAVGRKQALQIKALDLNEVVSSMVLLLKRTLGEDVSLNIQLADDVGLVEGDSGGVEQIILNLAVNARDAMPQGGTLAISTRRAVLDEEYCRMHVAVEAGTYGVLVVKDYGCGMSSDVRERIFEPFFTTKEKGKGTGLGLSTVYGIVRQCQGCIEVESKMGMGSEFRIFFRSIVSEVTPPGGGVSKSLPRGCETVLVVEDDQAVGAFAGRALSSLGYTVIEATSAKDALKVCEERADPLHLILTDVVLPEISGLELVATARKMRQDFKVLYVTGFGQEAVAHHGLDFKHDRCITKPYTQEILADNVRRTLDGSV